eukprot:14682179-Alexandrium_andersonii.AAC.1
MGFPTWASSSSPCLFCKATAAELYQTRGFSIRASCCEHTTMQDYEQACAACEVWVDINTVAQKMSILHVLHYDKRPAGAGGRALTTHLPSLGLRAGDRLEPQAVLRDVGSFQDIE